MKKKYTDAEINAAMEDVANWAQKAVVPQLKNSIFCMAMMDERGPDIYLAVQVGLALLYEKPLIIVATGGVWIPPRVRKLADIVVEGKSFDLEMKGRVTAAIRELERARRLQ